MKDIREHPDSTVAADTIAQIGAAATADSAGTSGTAKSAYEVLRTLPRDATPAQQDSAIQAWFNPGEIHYSQQPDTLHLPGHAPAVNLKEVNLPQYYRENFFSRDTMFFTETGGGRFGVAGDPIPYTIRGDNLFTSLLLLSFVVLVVSIAHSQHFIERQLKDFFYVPHNDTNISETSGELRFQLFLVLLACLLEAIGTYQFTKYYIADTFVLDSVFLLVTILFGIFVGYHALKWTLYAVVNGVFFGSQQNVQWQKLLLFITASFGVMLFPVVMLVIYFELSLKNALIYLGFVFILTKFLTFYKSWSIFFRQNDLFLQNILYFCTLEIIPVLTLASGILVLIDHLKLIF